MSVVEMRIATCFVDLSASSSEEDDDEDVVLLTEFPAHLAHRAPRKSQTKTIAAVSSDVVILEEADKTIELRFGAGPENESQRSSQKSSVLDDNDDDCCILSEDPSKVGIVRTSSGNDSDDLVMTGEVGQVACRDFPHARHQCVQLPFKTTAHELFCSQCHCYVCDVLAPCSSWGNGTRGGDHCHASDKIGEKWKMLRQYTKRYSSGSSDAMSLQQLLSPGGRPSAAGKFDSSIQRCSHPAGYEHLLLQSKEFVSQCFSDLFGSEREGNNDSTSFRGLPVCRPGPDDSTRSQHPLPISLNLRSRDLSSCPRGHHSQELGARSKVLSHGYLHRKDSHYSNLYLPYQSGGGDGYQRRRFAKRKASVPKYCCPEVHPPHSSSLTGSIQRSQGTLSAVPYRRPIPGAAATIQQESRGGTVPNRDTVLSEGFLEEVFFSSSLDRTGQGLQQQCVSTEPPSLSPPLNFGSATLLSQDEIGTYNSHSQGNGTVGSGNTIFGDTQFSRGSLSKADESVGPSPLTSPTLLAEYLLDEETFWNDLQPENFDGI